jgi:hypothetical protein
VSQQDAVVLGHVPGPRGEGVN